MIRYLRECINRVIDQEGFTFLEFRRLLRTRSELEATNTKYDPFKISQDLARPWTFQFLNYQLHKYQTETLPEFEVSNIFAISCSKSDLTRYDSLLEIPEHVSKTPENEEAFQELLAGMQDKFDRKHLTLHHYEWAGKFTLSNADYSHRTIAVLKYLSEHKRTALVHDVELARYQKPPALDGFATFILNPKDGEEYSVRLWLQGHKIEFVMLNKMEFFVAVPAQARIAALLTEASSSHGVWKNPFF